MPNFTPGPWLVAGDRDDAFEGLRVEKDGGPVCEISFTTGYGAADVANANLIAAAPDMYAALSKVKEFLDRFFDGDFDEGEPELSNAILVALVRAEGKAAGA